MHDLKVLTQNLLVICKRKNSNYLAEKVGKKNLYWVIKINITKEGQMSIEHLWM